MPRVLVPKTQNKISPKAKPAANKQANKKRKNELNVTITRPNIFEMGDTLSEGSDTYLEIFHQTEESGNSTLPSIGALLSSRDKDSGETVNLCDTTDKSQRQIVMKKYLPNEDILISKYVNSELIDDKRGEQPEALPLTDETNDKLHDLSISHMFSDGLSQKENFGEQFCDFSGSDDSLTDLLLCAPDLEENKGHDISTRGNTTTTVKSKLNKNIRVPKKSQENKPSPLSKAHERKTKFIRMKLENVKKQRIVANNTDKGAKVVSEKPAEKPLPKIDWNSFSFINGPISKSEQSNGTIKSRNTLQSLGDEFTVCSESRHNKSSLLRTKFERNEKLKNIDNVSNKNSNIFSENTTNNSSENKNSGFVSILDNSLDNSEQTNSKKSTKNKKRFKVSNNSSPSSSSVYRIGKENKNNSTSVTLKPDNFTSKITRDNNEKEYKADSYHSETDFSLSGIISDNKNMENYSSINYGEKQYNVPALLNESCHNGSNSPCTNFERDKRLRNTDEQSDAVTNIFCRRNMHSSPGEKYSGSVSLLNNSTVQSQHPKITKLTKTVEQFIDKRDSSLALSSLHKIHEESVDFLTPTILDPGHSTCESIADCNVCAATVNIALSECNLDHLTNSDYTMDGSIERMNETASWYLNNDDLMNNKVDLTPQLMSCNKADNLGHFESMHSWSIFNENDSVSKSEEKNDAPEINTQQSESIVEIFGTQISGLSQISLTPCIPDFNLSPNLSMTSKQKNLNYNESGRSSFTVRQYLQSPFLPQPRTKNKCDKLDCRTMRNAVRQVIDEHVCSNNKDKPEYEREFSIVDANKKCLKRLYPFDENIEYLDGKIETEKEENFVIDVDVIDETIRSKKPFLEIDQTSSTSLGSSITSVKNINNPSTLNSFWKVSHEVQSFVMEWLRKNDETNSRTDQSCVNNGNISFERKRLDLENEEQETSDINLETLLANDSCEYKKIQNY